MSNGIGERYVLERTRFEDGKMIDVYVHEETGDEHERVVEEPETGKQEL